MGDAGPQTPVPVRTLRDDIDNNLTESTPLREINILVTGYGPFKSFSTNPSFLIASSIPAILDPLIHDQTLKSPFHASHHYPIRPPDTTPYKIIIHTHPEPVRVAFASVSNLIPKLIASGPPGTSPSSATTSSYPYDHAIYDYIFHIGMAGGRENYTLETNASRDHYKVKDVTDRDGFISGEYEWKRQGLPASLDVGWNKEDVLSRWQTLTNKAEDDFEIKEHGSVVSNEKITIGGQVSPQEFQRKLARSRMVKRAEVALSKDAGRYLCEYILYTSLSYRWKEARDEGERTSSLQGTAEPAKERIGKVCFLHVPGGVEPQDIARGTRVAEAAILAVVGSWEAGYRNKDVYHFQA